jgi:hypothetical protein
MMTEKNHYPVPQHVLDTLMPQAAVNPFAINPALSGGPVNDGGLFQKVYREIVEAQALKAQELIDDGWEIYRADAKGYLFRRTQSDVTRYCSLSVVMGSHWENYKVSLVLRELREGEEQ